MMRHKLPPRQEAVLDAIIHLCRERGYAPTIRELCEYLGLSSPATVHEHLKGLETRGLISRPERQSRRIEITNATTPQSECDFVRVPLIEEVKNGTEFFDEQNVVEYLALPSRWIFDDKNLWILRLPSETAPGVCARGPFAPGDYLLLKFSPGETPHYNEMVGMPECVTINKNASTHVSTRILVEAWKNDESRPVWGRIIGVFRPPVGF